MTLRHLKIYVAVCQESSITKGAKKMFLSQPTVSLAIAELEKHYGIQLFDRISKRIYITDAGRRLLQYAQHITSVFDEMETSLLDWDNSGTLRIGTSITIGNRLLPSLLGRFAQLKPQVKTYVMIDNSQMIEQGILENKIDIGLIEGVTHSPFLHREDFLDDELVLVCSPRHSWAQRPHIDIGELSGQPLLMRERGSGAREVLESVLKLHETEVEPAWESISTQAIIQGVYHNMGVAVLPFLLVEEDVRAGRLHQIAIENLSIKRKFSIITHKNKYVTDPALQFRLLCCP